MIDKSERDTLMKPDTLWRVTGKILKHSLSDLYTV